MLASRWITKYFNKGYHEVRILFDQVRTQGLSPKLLERSRRDGDPQRESEHYDEIHNNTMLPKTKWIEFLKNRTNKQLLCNYLSERFIHIVPSLLCNRVQKFFTSGGFKPDSGFSGIEVTKDRQSHHIVHNHKESDTQIWLHVKDSSCSITHVYSTDRDIARLVYHCK